MAATHRPRQRLPGLSYRKQRTGVQLMWIDRHGKNYTHNQVCSVLERQCGSATQAGDLIATYRVGAIYCNGGIWFQRVA